MSFIEKVEQIKQRKQSQRVRDNINWDFGGVEELKKDSQAKIEHRALVSREYHRVFQLDYDDFEDFDIKRIRCDSFVGLNFEFTFDYIKDKYEHIIKYYVLHNTEAVNKKAAGHIVVLERCRRLLILDLYPKTRVFLSRSLVALPHRRKQFKVKRFKSLEKQHHVEGISHI